MILIFTDLDGTLLAHDDYSWAPARTALVRLMDNHIPLIPVSSKTLAEIEETIKPIGFIGPIAAENGSIVRYPDGSTYIATPNHKDLCAFINDCRRTHRFRMTGFADLSIEDVAHLTNLSFAQAALAKQRDASEALLWQDDAAQLQKFKRLANQAGFTILQGGRFLHLLGNTNKGIALTSITDWYRQQNYLIEQTIALGDSDNDRLMLCAADCPIIMRKPDNSHMTLPERPDAIISDKPGPEGWNQMILNILHQKGL